MSGHGCGFALDRGDGRAGTCGASATCVATAMCDCARLTCGRSKFWNGLGPWHTIFTMFSKSYHTLLQLEAGQVSKLKLEIPVVPNSQGFDEDSHFVGRCPWAHSTQMVIDATTSIHSLETRHMSGTHAMESIPSHCMVRRPCLPHCQESLPGSHRILNSPGQDFQTPDYVQTGSIPSRTFTSQGSKPLSGSALTMWASDSPKLLKEFALLKAEWYDDVVFCCCNLVFHVPKPFQHVGLTILESRVLANQRMVKRCFKKPRHECPGSWFFLLVGQIPQKALTWPKAASIPSRAPIGSVQIVESTINHIARKLPNHLPKRCVHFPRAICIEPDAIQLTFCRWPRLPMSAQRHGCHGTAG